MSGGDVSVTGPSGGGGAEGARRGGGPEAEAAELAEVFLRTARRVRREAFVRLAPFGMTPSQGRALSVLARSSQPMRLNELAGVLGIAPRSATTVVDALEAASLVVRVPDLCDRRATRVEVTGAGREMVERTSQVRRETAEDLFGALAPVDRSTLLRVQRELDATDPGRATGCRPAESG